MRYLLSHPSVRLHLCQFCKFAVCGLIGASLDLGSLTFLVEVLDMDPRVGFIFSTLLAVIFVFIANKRFTFENRELRYGQQVLKFALVYGVAIMLNLTISYTLLWFGMYYLLAKICAIGFGAFWNYTLSHSFVFRKAG